ncbi:MAG: MFS transporter [Hyphomonadaceae bacterium]
MTEHDATDMTTHEHASSRFFGHTVVRSAFVLAVFGWGIGFYSPPIFLHAVVERTGWPLQLVSMAVTLHFLLGAAVVAGLPRIHGKFGMSATTLAGAVLLALGVLGWATAAEPWQLFIAAAMTGAGWVTMGAAAINAIISPWFVHLRPIALSKAYNGASIGGVIFSPLWVALMPLMGFTLAAVLVGVCMVIVVAAIALRVVARTPQTLGQQPDGYRNGTGRATVTNPHAQPLPGARLWRDRGFVTLAVTMALSLFAQVGLLAHLYSLLAVSIDERTAGNLMALATACAIGGRTIVVKLLSVNPDRRIVLCVSSAVQMVGSTVFFFAAGEHTALIVLGVCLFGFGIGNATSLPPLIAQVEFAKDDVARVVALIVAISQGFYAFAPAAFGFLLASSEVTRARFGAQAQDYLLAALAIQAFAMTVLLVGRKSRRG